jgi:hypothetical protein
MPRRLSPPVLVLLGLLAACRSAGRSADVAIVRPAAPAPTVLELADRAYESGDLEVASAAYREHLEDEADAASDRALFRRGLFLYGSDSAAERDQGRALLERLLATRPQSEYRWPSETVLRLDREIEALQKDLDEVERQLEILKRIDLDRARSNRP